MTISTTTNKKQCVANGTQDTFPYDFLVLNKTHLKVYVDDTLKTEGIAADYTVTGIGNPAGGNVVFNATKIPANEAIVTILRDVPIKQETDYVENDPFPAETHEAALDELTMITQQLKELITRATLLTIDSLYSDLTLPDPVAEYYLAWKADLSGLKNVFPLASGELSVSSFVESLLDDADAAAFLTTMGIDTDLLTLALPADTTISTFVKTLLNAGSAAAFEAILYSNKPLLGDATTGRVIRASYVRINDGAGANTIKVAMTDVFNGDSFSYTGDIAKGATVSNVNLSADGITLEIQPGALSGNCVGILSSNVRFNSTTTAFVVAVVDNSNNIQIKVSKQADGTFQDMTALVDTGSNYFDILVCYITDA